MQYGMKRMINNWKELKLQHPDQINAVYITDAEGHEQTCMHIRTQLFNQLIRNESMTIKQPDLTKYAEGQKNTTVDNLTSQLTALKVQIGNLEQQLHDRYAECNITKTVLRDKLETKLQELNPEDTIKEQATTGSFTVEAAQEDLEELYEDAE